MVSTNQFYFGGGEEIDFPQPIPKSRYKIFRIPKKRGRTRLIYAPYGAYKRWLQNANMVVTVLAMENQPSINKTLLKESKTWTEYIQEFINTSSEEDKYKLLCEAYRDFPVHGFMPGKNPVTAAIPHIGKQFTLSIDLEDFFDEVEPNRFKNSLSKFEVPRRIKKKQQTALFPTKRARQGLPTSPAVSNIAAFPMDEALIANLEQDFPGAITYTRYADDLSFSFDDKEIRNEVKDKVMQLVAGSGWKVNEKKTRLQWGGPDGTWTRDIVGVGVNHEKVLPLRKARKKFRGLSHRMKFVNPEEDSKLKSVYKGMSEWTQCKVPKDMGNTYLFITNLTKQGKQDDTN